MEIPLIIWNSVRKYFGVNLPEYKVQDILKNTKQDSYMVIAQHKNGSWSCWINWDETNQKLECQHDDMPDYDMALLVCEYFMEE